AGVFWVGTLARSKKGKPVAPRGSYKTLNALMRHIRNSAGITVGGSGDKKALAQVGYFHGYKGYRYSGSPTRQIPYAEFRELRAVMEFDTRLKALLYPILMWTEMTMKNLALVEILEATDSSALSDVYAKLMPGTKRGKRRGKLEVIHASNSTLLSSYRRNNAIVRHYYDSPHEAVPVWGLMEVISLGHFARFLEQLSDTVLNRIAACWGLQRRYGELVPHLVFALTDLRNSVAHNGSVFDTRFATGSIRRQVKQLLESETGFPAGVRAKFDTITDYFVLIIYLAYGLGMPKRECRSLIRQYSVLTDDLHARVPLRVFNTIVHTDNRTKVRALKDWVISR
ncbi:MAG: Abi family protein, partial [Actinomycetota bacterium]|nr:Abi family protein [Actinomycetota bacterium]